MYKILFVCTGNTCRSPMAEAIARSQLDNRFHVSSAGVAAQDGQSASEEAITVMAEMGLGISRHISRRLTSEMLDAANLVLTMTESHKRNIQSIAPDAVVYTLGEYAGVRNDISDPFGGDRAVYRAIANQLKALIKPFIKKIKEAQMNNLAEIMAKRLHINEHPLVKSKMTMLRNKNTGPKEFRELVGEIAAFLSYEATYNTPIMETMVTTPVSPAKGWICEQKFGLVPILRAGLGMVEGISNLLPTAKIGHIGIYRNPETLLPVEYYCKLPPEIEEREILLLDPMLATGRTAEASIRYLKDAGAKHIKMLCIVTVREGVEQVLKNHPEVDIYTAAFDERLNDHGYIVPGLGDAGDRLFGTR